MDCPRCGDQISDTSAHSCLPASLAARKSQALQYLLWGGLALAFTFVLMALGWVPALFAWTLLGYGSLQWTLATLPLPQHPAARWTSRILLGLVAIAGSGLLVLLTYGASFGVSPRTTWSIFSEFLSAFPEWLRIRS